MKFFDWAFAKGQRVAEELDYVPIPEEVVKRIQAKWNAELQK